MKKIILVSSFLFWFVFGQQLYGQTILSCPDKSGKSGTITQTATSVINAVHHPSVLAALSGYAIKKDSAEIILVDNPEFSLDSKILEEGKAQVFSALMRVNDLPDPLVKAIGKIDLNKLLESEKTDKISFLKLAYIIPNTSAGQFDKDLMMNKDYIQTTNKGIFLHKPQHENGDIRTEKQIPLLSNAHSEFSLKNFTPKENDIPADFLKVLREMNEGVGAPGRISLSQQLESNYLQDSLSINHYYDLPDGSGTLIISHTLGSINFKKLGWFTTKIFNGISDHKRVSSFIEETNFMIDQNREWFSSKKTK